MTQDLKKQIVQRIIKNLLDIQILKLINTQPMWGYKIKKQIENQYGIKIRHGALYPLLNELERKGFLKSQQQRQNGRTRKTYIEAYDNILKEQIQNKT